MSSIEEIRERISKVEERGDHTLNTLSEIKMQLSDISSEIKAVNKKIGEVKHDFEIAKASYSKVCFYWKTIAFIVSPIFTILITLLIQSLF